MDKISLIGLVFFGHHGTIPEERKVGQRFTIDLELFADLSEAAMQDDLTKSIDYTEVFQIVKNLVEGSSFQLLEALALTICKKLLDRFSRIQQVTVRVQKPNVPLPGTIKASAVEFTRSR